MKDPLIISEDPWLEPYKEVILNRMRLASEKKKNLLPHNVSSLYDFANGHHSFGCFEDSGLIVFREWLPNAKDVFLIGDFSQWIRPHQY